MKLNCGHTIEKKNHTVANGYGQDADGKTSCYQCCAENDRQYMLDNGKITLYLSQNGKWHYNPVTKNSTWNVTNWPNSLSFPVHWYKTGKHNFAGIRYDVYFVGPDNHIWHGVQYGDNTQLCHCKRTKEVRKW